VIDCRSCERINPVRILSLGRTPLANALVPAADVLKPEPTYPLDLVFCPECSLVQITETVPREVLFTHYMYFSSFSDTIVRHAADSAARLIQSRKLGSQSLVVEVASNDGYLLRHYRQAGVPVLGIEPAANIARVAETEHGIPTRARFFDQDLARALCVEGHAADVIHANNVLAHVADLHGFVRGLRLLLKDDGIAVLEVPYIKSLIDNCEFDTIYHEHLCYFSLKALNRLLTSEGMRIHDVEMLPMHGGSLRVVAGRCEHPMMPNESVAAFLRQEERSGTTHLHYYEQFASMVEAARSELVGLLHRLKREGRRIAAYGASAKGSTLLNFCGIGRDILDFVADRSTVKQGHYTPGTQLPICAPERLLEEMPDYVLLLTWNFADEILEQQRAFRERGGRFIIPIPKARVV
jgi:SAM-dependent methyltransferase